MGQLVFAIFLLFITYGFVFLLVPWLAEVATERFTMAQTNVGEVFSLDGLLNTEVEVDNERILISELIYKADIDDTYTVVLEREIKKILDGFDFTFDNWADYDGNSKKMANVFVAGYAVAVYSGNKLTAAIEGENFYKEYCVDKCRTVASYELYPDLKMSLYKSMVEA